MYTASPEDRKSVTIIESISADGKALPPTIIIQGKQHMESWFHTNLTGDELVLLSDSGYTNEELAILWLKHFIKYTGAGPESSMKILLMDSHPSHTSPQFTLLAHANCIIPFTFPSHLTHCLQPLDVGVFQPYKHWHKKAIQYALRSLDIEYNIASFFRDLDSIRTNTFKPSTIINSFRDSGIWPINCKAALKKMKVYSKPELETALELPTIPSTPATFSQSELGLRRWTERVPDLLSSPSRKDFRSWAKGTEEILVGGDLKDLEHNILVQRVEEQNKKKTTSRQVVQKGGALTVVEAREKIRVKEQKKAEVATKRAARASLLEANAAKKALHRAGIDARKAERERKKAVQQLIKAGEEVPEEMLVPILDPEKEAIIEEIEKEVTGIDEEEEEEEEDDDVASYYSVTFIL